MLRSGIVVVAIAAFAVAGCKEKQPAARKVTPPTAAEAEVVGKAFAKHLAPCNTTELDNIIDVELILARSVANRSIRSSEVKGIARGLGGLGARLCAELQDPEMTATFLRTLTVEGAPRPLIRLVFSAGVNYYQLELDKRPDNKIVVGDIYLYLAGEKMSETLGSALDMLMKTSSSSAVTTVTQVKTHMRAGEWKEALALQQTLPVAMRASKPMMLNEVLITSELTDKEYVEAMDKYAKAYPNDPSLALIQIDRTLLRKDYTGALKVVETLDKDLGGDPYLELFRVDAYLGLNKFDEALAAGKRGVTAEPTLEVLWWALLTAQAKAEKYGDALATLEALATKFKIDVGPESLASDERFVKLGESKEYKAWVETHYKAGALPD